MRSFQALFLALLFALPLLRILSANEGCMLDPNGACHAAAPSTSPPAPSSPGGSCVDPNGACYGDGTYAASAAPAS